MLLENFWYTYKNILLRAVYKKKYLAFIRKIFGTLYKFIRRFYLNSFSSEIINLDKLDKKKFRNFSLDKLFISFNCDKGSYFIVNDQKILTHKYSKFYNKYFSKIRKKKLNILELGSHEGKSIASFYYYFPNAKFFGANINPFQMKYTSKRIEELYVDVSSEKILNNLAKKFNFEFDLIIDDASHNLRDILITLPIFFKKLKKKGFYVIEDVDQFKVFKQLNPTNDKLTPLKILKYIKKNKKFKSKYLKKRDVNYLKENIKKYYFEKGKCIINGLNVSDIVFLQKK